MSARVQKHSAGVQRAEADLAKKNRELELDLLQGAVDAAGIVDPTPVSDLIGAGLSASRGDLVGAGLSLISAVPYVGDALGKTAKGARAVRRLNNLRAAVARGVRRVREAKLAAHKAATAEIRAQRAAEAARKAREAANCATCRKPNPWGTILPDDNPKLGRGRWSDPAQKGNSIWVPDAAKYPDAKPVRYKNGHPDFTPYTRATVELEDGFDLAGTRTPDFKKARETMRKRLADPKWHEEDLVPEMTWHHHEDGVTLQLVPTAVHRPASHAGGVTTAKDPTY